LSPRRVAADSIPGVRRIRHRQQHADGAAELALILGDRRGGVVRPPLSAGLGAQGAVKVVGTTAVGARERVVVVEVDDTWLLLGVGGGNVRLLHTCRSPGRRTCRRSTRDENDPAVDRSGLSARPWARKPALPLLSVTPGAGGQVIGVPAQACPGCCCSVPAGLRWRSRPSPASRGAVPAAAGAGQPHGAAESGADGAGGAADDFRDVARVEDHQRRAFQPYLSGALTFNAAAEQAAAPLKSFMLRQTRAEDLSLFTGDDKTVDPAAVNPTEVDSVPLAALAPAFLTSELKTAFQIGFMVVLPFLVIDLVVAAVLTALGMIMLPPQLVSLPLKLLLFVTVDGWHLLVGSLLGSF